MERLVFFCDAVIAIAITLLALDIKIDHATVMNLNFSDIFAERKKFLAFFLSFINIAIFRKNHHIFFSNIKKIDERTIWINICRLFFIVLLPFSTSLVSGYFFDKPAILIYSINILMIAIFQNWIWDYATYEKYLKEDEINEETIRHTSLYCNLDMINSGLAVLVAFVNPTLAFILLFTKLPMFILATFYVKYTRLKESREKLHKKPK